MSPVSNYVSSKEYLVFVLIVENFKGSIESNLSFFKNRS